MAIFLYEEKMNVSFPFKGERQAQYFSHARNNMRSDMAHATMSHSNQSDDIKILAAIKNSRK